MNPSSSIPFSSASPTLGSREMLRKRDMPSHLILRDPLEEPEVNDLICLDSSSQLYSYFMPVLFLVRDLNNFVAVISTAHRFFLVMKCLVICCIR